MLQSLNTTKNVSKLAFQELPKKNVTIPSILCLTKLANFFINASRMYLDIPLESLWNCQKTLKTKFDKNTDEKNINDLRYINLTASFIAAKYHFH